MMFLPSVFIGVIYCFWFVVGYTGSVSIITEQNLDVDLQITTVNGKVQGQRSRSFGGRSFLSFRGIPYGKPPVGNLRFRAPLPTESWTGVLDATKEGPSCVEIFLRYDGVFTTGSEDCLVLNVFTPMDPKNLTGAFPVLVWFYGGAFMEGNSSSVLFSPEFLLDQDVVVVTLNYRVGLFGFLSTEDLASPGNYGLKDQALALRWVRANIKKFGGDPNRVTISGQSAGAASVLYHMASPKSRGLFHRAIACSGTSLSFFAIRRGARHIAFEVGTGLGIDAKNSKELMARLRKVNVEKLNAVTRTLATLGVLSLVLEGFPFSPVIEPRHKDAFISESTYSLLEKGNFNKVPILLGTTSDESVFFHPFIRRIKPFTVIFELSAGSLPNQSLNIASPEQRTQVGNEIKRHYFSRGTATEATVEEIGNLIYDDQFLRPIRKTAQLALKYTPVYFYVFSYESGYGVRGFNDEAKGMGKGVAHSEDITYIWKRKDRPYPSDPDDKLIVSRMVKLWINFATTGNPTPTRDPILANITWPALKNPMNIKYLNIDTTLSIRSNFRDDYMKFWDNIYETYGGKSYVTY